MAVVEQNCFIVSKFVRFLPPYRFNTTCIKAEEVQAVHIPSSCTECVTECLGEYLNVARAQVNVTAKQQGQWIEHGAVIHTDRATCT